MTKPRFPKPFMILAVMALVSALGISLSSPVTAQVEENENQEESDEPDTDEPDTDEPDTDEPDTDEPDTDEPDTDEPDTDEPDTDEPDTDEPDTDEPDTDEPDTNTIRVTVVRGDTLWGLARTHLGSGFRWSEIFALNEEVVQADGRALTNPDLILIGWVLDIPVGSDS